MALNRSILALAFILITAPVGADEPAKKADQAKQAKQDLETLQGTWRLDENESLSFQIWMTEECFPHFLDIEAGKVIEVKGDKLRYGKKLEWEITILLGTRDGKKTISFRNGANAPTVGIYELDKGVFRICAVNPKFGGGKEEVRLPEKCGRTRGGWFFQFEKAKP